MVFDSTQPNIQGVTLSGVEVFEISIFMESMCYNSLEWCIFENQY